jgi:uroporphyrinogen decarboxylase
LNSIEQIFAALENKIPHYIPHFELEIDEKIIHAFGGNNYTYADFVEELDLDAIVISLDYKIKKIDKSTFKDEWGIVRKVGMEDYPVSLGGEYSRIKTMKDMETYEPPSFEVPYRFESLEQAVDRFKGRKAVVVRLHDVWSIPRDLHGYQETLEDTILNKELISKLVNLSVNYNKDAAKIATKIGADVVVTTDDIAGNDGLIMSPNTWEELFWPKFKELFVYFKEIGLYTIKHTDGYIMPIMDKLTDVIDCINPIDPLARMSLKEVKEKYGKKVSVMGNADCEGILVRGDFNEIETEVKRCIFEGGPNGGYIFSSSNSIHGGITLQSYIHMLKTWKKYRNYPLKCSY